MAASFIIPQNKAKFMNVLLSCRRSTYVQTTNLYKSIDLNTIHSPLHFAFFQWTTWELYESWDWPSCSLESFTPKVSHVLVCHQRVMYLAFELWSSLICTDLTCTTVGGADPGKSCVFPFIAGGVTFTECTLAGNSDDDPNHWCSTLIDESGNHVGGQGKWGHCAPECLLTTSGKRYEIMKIRQFNKSSTLFKEMDVYILLSKEKLPTS